MAAASALQRGWAAWAAGRLGWAGQAAFAAPPALALVAVAARLSVGPLTIDDAYITFRYAVNLATGQGFVYNAGERVLGSTTPLWTLVLAGAYRLGATDLPRVALLLSALADGMTTLLLWWMAQRLGFGGTWAALVAAAFALNPLSLGFAASGMESSLFTLLIVASSAADAGARPGVAGCAAGLATVTRPEGALMGALVLARHLLARRLPPWWALIGAAVPVLTWVAFALWWFGSPLPQSVVAKAVVYRVPWWDSARRLLFESNPSMILVFLTVLPLALAPGAALTLRRRPERLALVAFAPLLALAYGLAGLRNVFLFPWYLVPLVPFALLGLIAGGRHLTRRLARPVAHLAVATVFLVGVATGFNLGRNAAQPALMPRGPRGEFFGNLERERAYTAAAQVLAPRLERGMVVALPEIGAFGYTAAGATVLDLLGLVSPQVLPFYRPPYEKPPLGLGVPPAVVQHLRPDYLVGLDILLGRSLLDAEWFQAEYRLVVQLDVAVWGRNAVLVYERLAG